jgi:hypothetical protein
VTIESLSSGESADSDCGGLIDRPTVGDMAGRIRGHKAILSIGAIVGTDRGEATDLVADLETSHTLANSDNFTRSIA